MINNKSKKITKINNEHHCIFCKIVNNKLSSNKIYENNDVIAIFDICQTAFGHILIIPKKHYDNFLFLPKKIMYKIIDLTQLISKIFCDIFNIKNINIQINNGKKANQTIMHCHFHILPRCITDDCFQTNNYSKYRKYISLIKNIENFLKTKIK